MNSLGGALKKVKAKALHESHRACRETNANPAQSATSSSFLVVHDCFPPAKVAGVKGEACNQKDGRHTFEVFAC